MRYHIDHKITITVGIYLPLVPALVKWPRFLTSCFIDQSWDAVSHSCKESIEIKQKYESQPIPRNHGESQHKQVSISKKEGVVDIC